MNREQLDIILVAILAFLAGRWSSVLGRRERIDEPVVLNSELSSIFLTEEELRHLPGEKLQAIKLVRDRTGVDLKSAYSIVEYRWRHGNQPDDSHSTSVPPNKS